MIYGFTVSRLFYVTVPLLLAAFGFSLFFSGTDQIWFAPSLLCLLGMIFALIAERGRDDWQLPRSGTVFCVLAYLAYLFFALIWSEVPFVSTLFTFIFCVLPVLFLVLVLMRDPLQAARVHAGAVMVAVALCAVWALVQYIFFYETYGPRIHHPLLDPNNFAVLINMGIVPAALLFMMARKRSLVFLGLFALLYAATLVTQSRGGMISLIVGLVVLAPFAIRPFSFRNSRPYILIAIMLAMPFVLQLGTLLAYKRDVFGVVLSHGIMVSVTDRLALWQSSLHMALDNMLMGPGLGTFYYYYSLYRQPVDQSDGYFTHMDPLQFGAEAGLGLPLLFLAVLVAVLLRTIRAVRAAPAGEWLGAEIMAGFCGMLVFILHTMISFHFYTLPVLFPLACLMAWWYAATEKALADRRVLVSGGRRVVIACVLAGLFVIWQGQWLVRSALSVTTMNKVALALAQQDTDKAEAYLEKAEKTGPGSYFNIWQYKAKLAAFILINNQRLSTEDRRALYEQGLRDIDRAIDLNRNFSGLLNDRAQLYALASGGLDANGYGKAIADLREAVARDPLYLDARINLSSLYLRQGSIREALAVLEDGLKWPRVAGQSDIDFIVMIARLRLQLGDQAGHDFLINEARARAKIYGLLTNRTD